MEPDEHRLAHLIEDVFATGAAELFCDAVQPLLARCVSAQLSDSLSQERYPALWVHLRFCADCADTYRVLLDARRQEANPLTPLPPTPALPRPRRAAWTLGLGVAWQLITETGQIILRLLDNDPPAPMNLPALRKSGAYPVSTNDVLRRVTLTPQETGDLDVQLVVRRDAPDAPTATLLVRAQRRSQWHILAGATVVAHVGAWRSTAITDEDGEATLPGIPLADLSQLVVEISPPLADTTL